MQWWCAVQEGVAWEWRWQAYPGVWLFMLLLVAFYLRVVRRPLKASGGVRIKNDLLIAGGIFSLWLALDWPIGPLGAGFLAGVHMVQYLLIGVISPALLLLGIQEESWQHLSARVEHSRLLNIVTFPFLTVAIFVAVTVVSHLPGVVDSIMLTQWGSFGLDMAWFIAGLLFWWPVVSPVPHRPRFPAPLTLVYMFPATLAHTLLSIWLVFSSFPVYGVYELSPPTGWISAIGDQQVAGLTMWVVGGTIMWTIMGGVVLRWMRAQDDSEDAAKNVWSPVVHRADSLHGER